MVPAGPTNSLHRLASSASAAVRAARAWSRPGRSFSRSARRASEAMTRVASHARVKYGGGKPRRRSRRARRSFCPRRLRRLRRRLPHDALQTRATRCSRTARPRAPRPPALRRRRGPSRSKTRPSLDVLEELPKTEARRCVVSCRVRPRPGRVSGPPWRRRASRALGRCTSPVGRAAGRFSNHRGWSTRPSRSSRGRRRPQPRVPPRRRSRRPGTPARRSRGRRSSRGALRARWGVRRERRGRWHRRRRRFRRLRRPFFFGEKSARL